MPSVQLPSETLKVFPPHSCLPALTTHVAFFPNTTLILIHLTTLHTATDQQAKRTNQGHSNGGTPSKRTCRSRGKKERVREREASLPQLLPQLLLCFRNLQNAPPWRGCYCCRSYLDIQLLLFFSPPFLPSVNLLFVYFTPLQSKKAAGHTEGFAEARSSSSDYLR